MEVYHHFTIWVVEFQNVTVSGASAVNDIAMLVYEQYRNSYVLWWSEMSSVACICLQQTRWRATSSGSDGIARLTVQMTISCTTHTVCPGTWNLLKPKSDACVGTSNIIPLSGCNFNARMGNCVRQMGLEHTAEKRVLQSLHVYTTQRNWLVTYVQVVIVLYSQFKSVHVARTRLLQGYKQNFESGTRLNWFEK